MNVVVAVEVGDVTANEAGPDVTAVPLIVAVKVSVPPAMPAVNTAVYVPLPLSVTPLNVPLGLPLFRPNFTVKPPLVSRFPAASRAIRVRVAVPPNGTLAGETDTNDCAADRARVVVELRGQLQGR